MYIGVPLVVWTNEQIKSVMLYPSIFKDVHPSKYSSLNVLQKNTTAKMTFASLNAEYCPSSTSLKDNW